MQASPRLRVFFSFLLIFLIARGPFLRIAMAAPQTSHPGEGDANRSDPCTHLPDPQGNAKGIDKQCPALGSSSGVAKGDFNGDGVADLAVGIPAKNLSFCFDRTCTSETGAGAVQIIYGTAANGLVASGGVLPSQFVTEPSPFSIGFPGIERAASADNFGASLASGDFNHDGFSDLAVGIPGKSSSVTTARGAVMVFCGSSAGLSLSPCAFFGPTVFSPLSNPGNSHSATSLAWSDFDQDGFGDLVVASDYTGDFVTQTGAVTVLFGSASGLVTSGKLLFELERIPLAEQRSAPLILTAGDFNRDGFPDLVAGSPLADVGGIIAAGAVHVLYGSAAGPSLRARQTWHASSAGFAGGDFHDERFGAALAVGDFNRDRVDDLAIGAPGTGPGGGVIMIPGFLASGLQANSIPPPQSFFPSTLPGDGAAYVPGQFGSALAAGDFDGDGFKDLAIGGPTTTLVLQSCLGLIGCQGVLSLAAGMVAIVYGSDIGLDFTRPQVFDPSLLGQTIESSFTQFGSALTAWNFGRSFQVDLAIGAPLADVGGVVDAGVVHVLYGSSTGLTTSGHQIWTENSVLNNAAQAGDHFGQAVY